MGERVNKREISILISDSDCEMISYMAGKVNLTVPELIEGFLKDLAADDARAEA